MCTPLRARYGYGGYPSISHVYDQVHDCYRLAHANEFARIYQRALQDMFFPAGLQKAGTPGYRLRENNIVTSGKLAKLLQHMYQIEQTIDDIRNEGRSQLDITLGEDVRLRISPDYPFVNLRKFWKPPHKKELVPTASGVCLQFDDYSALKCLVPTINAMLPDTLGDKTLRPSLMKTLSQ